MYRFLLAEDQITLQGPKNVLYRAYSPVECWYCLDYW